MPILKLYIVWISNHSSNTSYNLSNLRCNFILRTQDCHNLHGKFAKNQSCFFFLNLFINPFCKLVGGMTNCDWKLCTHSYTRFCTFVVKAKPHARMDRFMDAADSTTNKCSEWRRPTHYSANNKNTSLASASQGPFRNFSQQPQCNNSLHIDRF